MTAFLESFFHVKEKGSTVRTEIIAGLTTFATMAYILAVNVSILSDAGLESGAVFVATALGAVIGTVAMSLLAQLPFALAPGMGLNAFFAYTVVLQMGFSPQFALAAVLAEGLIFIILSVTKVRTKIFNAIPLNLKYAVGGGIGLFIAFIGMKGAGIVVGNSSTLLSIGNVRDIKTALALIGLAITFVLLLKKVKGALLWGILATWILGIIAQLTGLYPVDASIGNFSLVPDGIIKPVPSLAPTFGLCFMGFSEAFSSLSNFGNFLIVLISFLFVDIFDTVGTLSGVASKANMLDKNGELEKVDQALLSDSIATACGAVLGTSTVTTFVESASGVAEGGRTGLTSMTVAVLFLLSLLFSPIFLAIPSFATATALIAVGIIMLEPIKNIDLSDLEELIPVGITLITMPLFYSISDGLIFGSLSYVIVKCATGKARDVSVLMWILSVLFLIKLIFI